MNAICETSCDKYDCIRGLGLRLSCKQDIGDLVAAIFLKASLNNSPNVCEVKRMWLAAGEGQLATGTVCRLRQDLLLQVEQEPVQSTGNRWTSGYMRSTRKPSELPVQKLSSPSSHHLTCYLDLQWLKPSFSPSRPSHGPRRYCLRCP